MTISNHFLDTLFKELGSFDSYVPPTFYSKELGETLELDLTPLFIQEDDRFIKFLWKGSYKVKLDKSKQLIENIFILIQNIEAYQEYYSNYFDLYSIFDYKVESQPFKNYTVSKIENNEYCSSKLVSLIYHNKTKFLSFKLELNKGIYTPQPNTDVYIHLNKFKLKLTSIKDSSYLKTFESFYTHIEDVLNSKKFIKLANVLNSLPNNLFKVEQNDVKFKTCLDLNHVSIIPILHTHSKARNLLVYLENDSDEIQIKNKTGDIFKCNYLEDSLYIREGINNLINKLEDETRFF